MIPKRFEAEPQGLLNNSDYQLNNQEKKRSYSGALFQLENFKLFILNYTN